jgi:hypothetical protein
MIVNKHIQCFVLLSALFASASSADDYISASGRLSVRGVEALHSDSVKEDPGATGRVKFDVSGPVWKFHSWLEGVWDGTVRRPARDHSLFKNYDEVYQSNTPYLEFKEVYLQYSSTRFDLKAGIQRFAWGRLDEFPPNDLLNPWDYTQFLRKPLEDRKIGVPSISGNLNSNDWTYDAVWVPWFVPYRLPMTDERWSGVSGFDQLPNAEIVPTESDLPARTLKNSNAGIRVRRNGDIEWALNLYHGFDPNPVFKTTAFTVDPQPGKVVIDPGYVPDFHRITSIGLDAAAVSGDWSLRAEAAYIMNRYYNIRRELWGYPSLPSPGVYPLNDIGQEIDAVVYGIGADYRLFEDGTLFAQAMQTVILGNTDRLYDRKIETILAANVKVFWMNQKVETNASLVYNPEHGANMTKAGAWYVFTDSWKVGISAINLTGPSQSTFGRYSRNDQVEGEIMYAW